MNEKKEVLNVNDELVKDDVSECKKAGLKKPLLVVAIGAAAVAAVTGVTKLIAKGVKKAKANKEKREIKDLEEKGYTILPPDELSEELDCEVAALSEESK